MSFLWALSEYRTPFLNGLFKFCTLFGEETIAIALICVLFWCVDKNLAYIIGFSYFLSGLLVQGLKITCKIDRPWILDSNFKPVEGSMTTATGYSFPSGHTQSSSSLFSTLGFRAKKAWLKTVCFAMIFFVGFSRMYLGVHTPKDVLVSFGLSVVISAVVCAFYDRIIKLRYADIGLSSFFLLCACGLMIYSISMYSAGTIELQYVSDCFKAAGAGIGFAVGFFIEHRFIRFDPRGAGIGVQLLKFVLGIGTTLALKSGLKLILGVSLAADSIRYAIVVLWIIAVFPLFIKKFFSKKSEVADDIT
ncbi:MAG: phosphatase PAP2 family protein [Oscillospiraceae bacterium]